jgi:VCBS repeat-containing protein
LGAITVKWTVTFSLTGTDAGQFAINPATGEVTFLASPNFEAPADADANNLYEVLVHANDGVQDTTQAVTIAVTDTNDVAPAISSGATGSEAENAPTSNVVYDANATDPDTVGTVSFSLTGPDATLFSIDSDDGEVRFPASPNYEAPADTGGNNVYEVVVHANDGVHDTTQAVTIAVTDVNDAPVGNSAPVVAGTDVTGAVTELVTPVGNLTDSGTIAFTDADLGDIHSVSAVTPSSGALGTLTASVSTDTTGSGVGGVVTWNYSVAAANVEFLAAGQHQIETFTFDVLDGQGGSVSRTVSVDITGTNDAAVLSAAAISLDETDAVLSTGGTLTISDPDSEASFVAQSGTEGDFGIFSIDPAGVWSYTAGSAFDDLNVGDSVSDSFDVTSADGTPTSVQVTIHGTNDAAVLSAAAISLDETDAVLSTGGTLTISGAKTAGRLEVSQVARCKRNSVRISPDHR